ncbi:ATP-binding cassette domain-containing protein [Streptomyces netropsis]|uniref:ATP-binding cassette domain-containing protein n=1 Tax=Streptomyces netropsis TaxID=55404 RepID=UPI0037A8CE9C
MRVHDVHKSYRSRRVLRGVSFGLEPGTLAGVVGENGSGKSTLLRILVAMTVASAPIAGYATAVICWYWDPVRPGLLALGLFTATVAYGGIGILLGAFLRNELAALFVIIMASLLDTMLQNPMSNTGADKDGLQLLPGYGPTQVSVAAGFTSTDTPYGHLLLGPLWFLLMWGLGTAAFFARTRNHLRVPRSTQPTRRLT